MHIIIAGGTGFIGQAMVKHYLAKGDTLTLISRSREKTQALFGGKVSVITWAELAHIEVDFLKKAQAIINLCGANIAAGRWAKRRKQELINSRIYPTQKLASLCATLGTAAPPLLNAGGVGIYGPQEYGSPLVSDEETPLDTAAPGFLVEIGRQWEAATQVAKNVHAPVVNMRFGVVLDRRGGALPRILLPFRLFLGGSLGSGEQPFPWIALPDLLNAVDFLLAHPEIQGTVNLVAPQNITQKQLAKTIGIALNRPNYLPMPAFLIKLLFGQMGEELMLNGQHVAPKVLLNAGFTFQYPTIALALKPILEEVA